MQKAILKEPVLHAFICSLHLNINLHETVNIRPQTLFLPLDDPAQEIYSQQLSLPGSKVHEEPFIEINP